MLFGYEEKTRVFRQLVASGNLGQSYLFFGDRGVGKASFAESLGNFLEFGDFEIGNKPLVDTRIFKPNERDVIGIGEALEVRHFLWETPLGGGRRFAIVDGAETMTPEAQGAMLKIVEEPPTKALLVLVTYDAEAIFPPLLSRLTKIYFPRLPKKTVGEILEKHYKVPAERAKRFGAESFGSLGRALDLFRGRSTAAEPDLVHDIEEEIIALRQSNLRKNAKKISLLLGKLSLLKRYNLNENLARRAIAYEIQKL